jgi:hypothetical protein
MTRSIYTGLLALALTACGAAAGKESVADSASGDTKTSRAERAKVHSTSGPSLPDGTQVPATIDKAFSSRSDKAGQTITASVSGDVTDARGIVVIPSGSTVKLTIATLDPGNDQIRPEGRLALVVNSVAVGGRTYPVVADLAPVTHQMVGRGITKDEAERIGAGTAIGAVAGRLIGKSTKGAVVGGAAGAIAGTAVAVHYAYRDVVVAANTPIRFTLSHVLEMAGK